MRGHERREERREERATFGARGNADRYQMREKMLSIGDDFWIEDESGPPGVQGQRQGAAGAPDPGHRGPQRR